MEARTIGIIWKERSSFGVGGKGDRRATAPLSPFQTTC